MEVLLTNLPIRVSRCSSGRRFPLASRSSVIVLNLMALKIFSDLPGLGCMKKGDLPWFAMKSNMEIATRTGDNNRIAHNAAKNPIKGFI